MQAFKQEDALRFCRNMRVTAKAVPALTLHKLFTVMRTFRGSSDIQLAALQALNCMSLTFEENRRGIACNAGVSHIAEATTAHPAVSAIQLTAVLLVSNLARYSPDARMILQTSPVVCDLLTRAKRCPVSHEGLSLALTTAGAALGLAQLQ